MQVSYTIKERKDGEYLNPKGHEIFVTPQSASRVFERVFHWLKERLFSCEVDIIEVWHNNQLHLTYQLSEVEGLIKVEQSKHDNRVDPSRITFNKSLQERLKMRRSRQEVDSLIAEAVGEDA